MYPDSAPENWRDVLVDHHINIIISPLHDKDINPGTTEYKKPHWHVICAFDNTKTVKQAQEIADSVNATIPVPVKGINGMIRYLTHLDNPEKAQYKKEDIINIGCYDIETAFTNSVDKYIAIKEMVQFIKENEVIEYIDFLDYCATNKFDDWFRLLCDSCSFVITSAINSNRNKIKTAKENGSYYKEDEE